MGKVDMYIGFWWGNLREGDHLEDLGVDVWIIFTKWDGSMNWIDLVQERDRGRALMNEVMNLRVL
jgi:hypothetical protein